MMWPFGMLLPTPRGYNQLFMGIDKFTKWIEPKLVTTIMVAKAIEFINEITNRYGAMNMIIMDNGTQFMGPKSLKFCDDKHIKLSWASMAHP